MPLGLEAGIKHVVDQTDLQFMEVYLPLGLEAGIKDVVASGHCLILIFQFLVMQPGLKLHSPGLPQILWQSSNFTVFRADLAPVGYHPDLVLFVNFLQMGVWLQYWLALSLRRYSLLPPSAGRQSDYA